MKKIVKKWWFWLIIIILIVGIILISKFIENKKIENKFKAMEKGMTDYYKGTKNANGYLDKFTYNYSSGKVDYKE